MGANKFADVFWEPYPYVCIECGQLVEGKERFFPLNGLLACMNMEMNGQRTNVDEYLRKIFTVGAEFGGPILGVSTVKTFRCESHTVPLDKLSRIEYSMENVVRTIEMQLGVKENVLKKLLFYNIGYDNGWNGCDLKALVRRQESGKATEEGTEEELIIDFSRMVKEIKTAAEPYIQYGEFGNEEIRNDIFFSFLDALKVLCVADPALQFTKEKGWQIDESKLRKLDVAWIYTVDQQSRRKSPKGLYIYDAANTNNPERYCRNSCCPYCLKPLSDKFGVYRQVTVGVLGGQSTGKTTYLSAFADFIDQDISRQAYINLPFTISYEPEGDSQWRRFGAVFDERGGSNMRPKWAYCHGYRVRKTDLLSDSAASLTFLVTPEEGEPILYILADIAGEVFDKRQNMTDSAAEAAALHKRMLQHCDALFMVMSCSEEDARIEASRYKEWMEKFPDKQMPAALILMKADKIFPEGKGLKYDSGINLYSAQPVIKSGKAAVYNTEVMASVCSMAVECAEKLSAGLLRNLENMMRDKIPSEKSIGKGGLALAAFPVCCGTEGYVDWIIDEKDPDAEEKRLLLRQNERKRYEKAAAERFGVAAPFMWLMALEGLLACGRGESQVLQYDACTEKKLKDCFYRKLRLPYKE